MTLAGAAYSPGIPDCVSLYGVDRFDGQRVDLGGFSTDYTRI